MNVNDKIKALNSEEWGEIYNPGNVKNIVNQLNNKRISVHTEEMIKLTEKGQKILEIGAGSGATSVWLAMHDRIATALDFSKNALACAQGVAEEMGVKVNTVFADATEDLPFEDNYFDVVFQAGLLEHFDKTTRIKLLKQWGKVGNIMISLIPNAASIAYRTGKDIMERNGTWEYGLELPQYSLQNEFFDAGFYVKEEYTIGELHALNFLPKRHYLRKALEKWIKENKCDDCCGQGYLLVTVGEKIKKAK